MKNIILIFAVILCTSYLFAQTGEDVLVETISDSLDTISDSLSIVTEDIVVDSPDSLSIEQIYQPGDSLYVPTREDSLAAEAALNIETKEEKIVIDLENATKNIQQLISNYNDTRKKQLPFMYYSENFHSFWPLSPNFETKKYGFTKRSYLTSTMQNWQNFSPDHLITYKNGLLNINSYNYKELPLLTISNLVLGEDDMNHAMISMMKGYILGIRDLNFSGSFLGQEGLWLGNQEKAANFGGHLFYTKNWGTLHYFYNQIEQDLSHRKLLFSDNYMDSSTEASKEQITEHTFRFDNKFLNIGFNYSDYSFDDKKLEDYQYMINREFDFDHTQLNLTVEYLAQKTITDSIYLFDNSVTKLKENSDETIFSFEHKTDLGFIETNNNFSYIDEDESSLNSSTILNFSKPIGLLLKYSNITQTGEENFSKTGAGLSIKTDDSNLDISGGSLQKNSFETTYIEADGLINIPFGNYNISYGIWALAITEEQDFYPTIQTRNSLELGYDLKRDNYLRIGLNQIFCQEFLQRNEVGSTRISEAFILDAYFAVQITKYFEFQLDIKNLTGQNQLFSYGSNPANVIPGLHFNAGVNWVFLN